MGNYPTLPYLEANKHTVTVSGFEAGCAMAHQFSIIYSGEVAGAVLFNCWPYGVDYDTLINGGKTEDELFEISKNAIDAAVARRDITNTRLLGQQAVYIYSGGDRDKKAPPIG